LGVYPIQEIRQIRQHPGGARIFADLNSKVLRVGTFSNEKTNNIGALKFKCSLDLAQAQLGERKTEVMLFPTILR
jgi:hypothetical protein